MLETSPHTTAKPYTPPAYKIAAGVSYPVSVQKRIVALYAKDLPLSEITDTVYAETKRPITRKTVYGVLKRAGVLRGRNARYDQETHDRAIAMYRTGYGIYDIARILTEELPRTVNPSTVSGWVKSEGIYGMEPEDFGLCTKPEIERRCAVRTNKSPVSVNHHAKKPPIERPDNSDLYEQRRKKEAQHPERQRWLPVIAAAIERFMSMPRYLDHLRNIARMRYADFATDEQICDTLKLTAAQLATDDAHPFAHALAKFVWPINPGTMNRACTETLLRSGVSVSVISRLYNRGGFVPPRQVAEELGYVQPSQLPTKENNHGC
jgi:hypothetical protein